VTVEPLVALRRHLAAAAVSGLRNVGVQVTTLVLIPLIWPRPTIRAALPVVNDPPQRFIPVVDIPPEKHAVWDAPRHAVVEFKFERRVAQYPFPTALIGDRKLSWTAAPASALNSPGDSSPSFTS
jgi:hypothetical protein